MRMKLIAIQAVKQLAGEMFDHKEFPANWEAIDKIERRFQIQGCGEALLKGWRENQQFHRDTNTARRIQYDDNAFHIFPKEEIKRLAKHRIENCAN